jgi:hypothetical protein
MFLMRRQIIKKAGSLLIAGLLVTGITTGVSAYAATSDTGSAGASGDSEYTLDEMLVYAIEDEYLAQAEYDLIIDAYGTQKPFSNIIKAEATHISLLEPLFEEYNIEMPVKDWESLVSVPASIEAAYAIGVETEEKNIAMYKSFLKENLPEDVRDIFEKLMNASEKHLAAFQRQVDGVSGGNGSIKGNGSGYGIQTGKGNGGTGGKGQGNRNASQKNCIVE